MSLHSRLFPTYLLTAAALCAWFVLPHAAHAAPSLRSVYPAIPPSSIGNPYGISVTADGRLFVIGSSTTTMAVLSEDGSTAISLSFSSSLPNTTGRSIVASGTTLYISTSFGASGRVGKYEVSGSSAIYVASGSVTGSHVLAQSPQGTLYNARSTALHTLSPTDLASLGSVSLGSAVVHMATNASGTLLYYTTNSGQLRSANPTVGSASEVALVLSLGTSVRVATDAGTNIYALTKAGSLRKYSSGGTLLWSSSGFGTGGLAVKNGTIYTLDYSTRAVKTHYPIGAVSTFTATADGADVDLSWNSGVLDSDTLGVTIVRSTTSYPASVTDGTVVTSNNTDTSLTNSALADGTYYYSIFNRTSGGEYGPATNATATVDTTPPSAPVLDAQALDDDVMLTWDTPAGTDSFMLRVSTVSAPANTSEGSLVTSVDSSVTSYSHTGLANGTYHYSIFALDPYGNASNAGSDDATVAVASSSSSSASSESVSSAPATQPSHGGGRGTRAGQTPSIVRPAASPSPIATMSAVPKVSKATETRVCARVTKRIMNPVRLKGINARLQKWLGFSC